MTRGTRWGIPLDGVTTNRRAHSRNRQFRDANRCMSQDWVRNLQSTKGSCKLHTNGQRQESNLRSRTCETNILTTKPSCRPKLIHVSLMMHVISLQLHMSKNNHCFIMLCFILSLWCNKTKSTAYHVTKRPESTNLSTFHTFFPQLKTY